MILKFTVQQLQFTSYCLKSVLLHFACRLQLLTSFCLQYSSSVQQSSSLTLSAGHFGLGVIEEIDDVTTTRFTPSALAAVSTLTVPLTAGFKSWF